MATSKKAATAATPAPETEQVIEETATQQSNPIAEALAGISYSNLNGAGFKEYATLLPHIHMNAEGKGTPMPGALQLDVNKKYDFEAYKIVPVKKVRFPGVKNSPVDITGIQIKIDKPVKTTRIPLKSALAFNGKIVTFEGETFHTVEGSQFADNGGNSNHFALYYLLKK